ncbi:MAG: hypothetical protein ACXW6J_22065 [Candidatus Binatia bacterium]
MIGVQHQSSPVQDRRSGADVFGAGAVWTLATLTTPMEPRLVEKLQQTCESAEPANADANPSRNLLTPIPVQ